MKSVVMSVKMRSGTGGIYDNPGFGELRGFNSWQSELVST